MKTKARISSFAAPTDTDIAAFEAMTDAEKRELLRAEIEKGLSGTPRKVAPRNIIALRAK